MERLRGVALVLKLLEELFQLPGGLFQLPGLERLGGGAGLLGGGERGGERGEFGGRDLVLLLRLLHGVEHRLEGGDFLERGLEALVVGGAFAGLETLGATLHGVGELV